MSGATEKGAGFKLMATRNKNSEDSHGSVQKAFDPEVGSHPVRKVQDLFEIDPHPALLSRLEGNCRVVSFAHCHMACAQKDTCKLLDSNAD